MSDTETPTAPSAIEQATQLLTEERTAKLAERDQAKAKLDALNAEIKALDGALKNIAPRAPSADGTPAPVAGDALSLVRDIMRGQTLSQAEVTKQLGRPKNTAKHALERLEQAGEVKRTGDEVNRSPVFTWVEQAA